MDSRAVLNRRGFIGALGAAGVAASGCGGLKGSGQSGDGNTIRIGYVSPRTGALAAFAESDAYVLGAVRKALEGGLKIGGRTYKVEIVTKDSQSSATRAAQVASDLINQDSVDFMLCTSAPYTTNPVSDQCEAAGVPCIGTICPWEMWFHKRGGSKDEPFTYTYLYFLGMHEETTAFSAVWKRIRSNHVVGGLWPNDVDGDIYRKYMSKKVKDMGWDLVASGAFKPGLQNFSSIISDFAAKDVQILQPTTAPPDWITFWQQANSSGFRPRMVCVSKALLFPSVAKALGPLAKNLTADVWWKPSFPFASSLDGTTAQDFGNGYIESTGRQWTAPMGFNYAIFEIAVMALKASGDPKNKDAVADAIGKQRGQVITGQFDFTKGPVKNVATTPNFAGQWRKDSAGRWAPVIVDNTMDPDVPVEGDLELLS